MSTVVQSDKLVLSPFCKPCLYELVTERLDMSMSTSDEEWREWASVAQVLVFLLGVRSPRIQRMMRQGRDLQEILTTQGCLACWHHKEYLFVVKHLKEKGLAHGRQIAEGALVDPDFEAFKS
jgi:hypothetical protein